jgi:transcription initiation factor TFIIA large subunit
MASNVSRVYIEVIDDVIGKVRDEFINYGAGDAVLSELQSVIFVKSNLISSHQIPFFSRQVENVIDFFFLFHLQLWEMKMVQVGAISGNIERPSASRQPSQVNPVHDLNVPYEGPTEEYETPTAEMLFPPVIVTPLFFLSHFSIFFYTGGLSNYG